MSRRDHTPLPLSARAYARVRREAERVRRRLNSPPPLPEVAGRAEAEAMRATREREERRLAARLEELQGILHDYCPDPDHQGGYRVTPGCVVGIRYEDEREIERYEVTVMEPEDAHAAPLRPDSPLARSLLNKEIGDAVSYLRPDGRRLTVMVESIED